jgi:flagellum-specific ATP synthase
LSAAVGDTLRVHDASGGRLDVEVVGFRGGRLLTTPLGPLVGIRPGARAVRLMRGATIPASFGLLGRVVDSFGRALDGGPEIDAERTMPVNAPPPSAFARRPIDHQLATGVRVVDAMLPLGVGQRMGIFAGAGVGKSTLLGQICRISQADVNVVGLIGERGRELNDFIRNSLGPAGLAKSVVIAATSDQPPLVRARGAEAATAVAEFFRNQGKSVLLVMDSVTRYAMALREAALAAGEPPATKGYPPSVFAALPRLLERAGTGPGEGVITALYTVLVEGDDLSDPIADSVRSIIDGHIVLSRSLAEKGHFPAVDVLRSISRLAPEIAPEAVMRAASSVRDMLSTYRDAQDLIQVGAYVAGSDPRIDLSVAAQPHIDNFLRQKVTEGSRLEDSLKQLAQLAALAQQQPQARGGRRQ